MADETFESEYARNLDDSREASELAEFREIARSHRARKQAKATPVPEPAKSEPLGWREQMALEMAGQGESGADFGAVEKIGNVTGAVAKDVAVGATEAPKAVVGGVVDFADDILSQAGDLSDWWNESYGDTLGDTFSQPGVFESKQAWRKRRTELEGNVFDQAAEMLPDIAQPDSTTGKMIRGYAKFMTAFVPLLGPAGKLTKAAGLTGTAAQIGSAAMAGFGSDLMMSAEANLSNMIQDTPLANPVNEFLSLTEDDNEVTKRLKTAIEGMGLGLISDGMVRGLRVLRSARAARAVEAAKTAKKADPSSFLEEMRKKVGAVEEEDFAKAFGVENLNDPIFTTSKEASLKAERFIKKTAERFDKMTPEEYAAKAQANEGKVFVGNTKEFREAGSPPDKLYWNAYRVDSEADIEELLVKSGAMDYDALKKAGRPGRTHEQVSAEAATEGITLEEILHRKEGNPLSDLKTKAARDLMESSTAKLLEMERVAMNGSDAQVFAYNKMILIHHALMEKLFGARADSSRSLNAWRIQASNSVEAAQQIQELLAMNGGKAQSIKMARTLHSLPDEYLRMKAQRKIMKRPTINTLREIATLGLLWSPKTHLTNLMSNTAVAIAEPLERAAAARYGRLVGLSPGERVEYGEATAMAFAELSSLKEALQASWRRARTGESMSGGIAGSKLDFQQPVIKAETYGIRTDTGFGRAVDMFGKVTRAPGTALMAEDEFFKMIGYRGEVAALSVRRANTEGIAKGWSRQQIKQRVAEIRNDPPDDIRMEAIDAARYKTFTRQVDGSIAKLAKNAQRLPLGYTVLPFVNTPANIFSYSFERVPGLSYLSKSWRNDIAAGGARGSLALTRTAAGAALLATALDMAHDGFITGSGNHLTKAERERQRRQGIEPNSFHIGGKYYSWQRFDQYAAPFALAAELSAVWDNYDLDDEDMNTMNELVSAASLAFANVVTDRSYMKGVSDVFEATFEPERNMEWYLQQRVQQHVPFSSALRTVEQMVDPTIPQTEGFFFEPIQALIPHFASKLPRKKNLHGEDIRPDPSVSAIQHATSPIPVSERRGHPIDEEMERLGFGVGRITQRTEFQGVDVNFHDFPRAYERYQEIAGQGHLEELNNMLDGGGHFGFIYNSDMINDAKREQIIRSRISKHRQLAQIELMDDPEHIDFRQYVDRLKSKKLERKFEGTGLDTSLFERGALQ